MLDKITKMTTLKIGDKAPDFLVKNELGKDVTLSDFSGKKVVLFFYPKDNTPGCTAESCNLRDHYQELKKHGFDVLGISADSEESHQKFIKKYDLPYHLLADTTKKMLNDYGVWGPKTFMGRTSDGIHRTTFVVDEEGIIERIFTKVKTKTHTEQILETY